MDRVLSYDEAAGRAGFVRRTLERLISVGDGPAVINLSVRRRGILESDLENWLLGRRLPPPAAPEGGKRGRGRPRKIPAATSAVA